MSDVIKTGQSGLIGFLHNAGNGQVSVPKPFQQEIFLFDTHVAGTTHIEGIGELAPLLQVEERLQIFREPDNCFDAQAIVIKTAGGVKIGYVPKADNVIFARLMDAGKLLFGRISAVEQKGNWVKIGVKVYLQERGKPHDFLFNKRNSRALQSPATGDKRNFGERKRRPRVGVVNFASKVTFFLVDIYPDGG